MEYTNYLDAIEVDKDLCLTIAMEECAELIQAISKAKRGKLDRDNLVEEIADVRICINWLLSIFEIKLEEELDLINYKRNRVVERLNRGEFKYMQDFNWEDFKNSKIAVRCKTEKEAKEFLNKCKNMGLKWRSGKDVNSVDYWRIFERFTTYICGSNGLEFLHMEISSLRGFEVIDFISENEIALNAMNDKPSCKDCIYRGINCTNIASKYYGEKVKLEDNCDLHKKGKSSHTYIEEMAKSICNNMKAIGHEPTEYLPYGQIEEDVIKPSHYKAGDFDVIAFCQKHDLSFDVGNVIKYVTRAGKKKDNSELQDLNKAMEYLRRRIEFVKGE